MINRKIKSNPGEAEAYKLGYTIHSHAGNYSSATYMKYNDRYAIFLTVKNNGTAFLNSVVKLVEIRVNDFSFPNNKNFHIFEKQITEVLEKITC